MKAEQDTSAGNTQAEITSDLETLIAECKKDVDRGLLRANLELTPEERLLQLQSFIEAAEELRKAVRTTQRQK